VSVINTLASITNLNWISICLSESNVRGEKNAFGHNSLTRACKLPAVVPVNGLAPPPLFPRPLKTVNLETVINVVFIMLLRFIKLASLGCGSFHGAAAAAPAILAMALLSSMLTNAAASAILALAPLPAVLANAAFITIKSTQDYAEAVRLWSLAATQGHADAQKG